MMDFAIIEITQKCNLNCSHCYLGDKEGASMPIENVGMLLDKLKAIGCKRITISGGEPFCEPSIIKKVSEYAKNIGLYVGIVTNGMLFDKVSLELFDCLDYIQVSVDGLKDTHDGIRGKGSFERVTEGIRYLIEKGYRDITAIQMTVSAINQYEFFDVFKMTKELGVKMSVERVTSVGNASNYKVINYRQYQEILDCIIDNNLLSSDPLVNVRKIQRLRINPRLYPIKGGCSAGKNGIGITITGEVLPCIRIRRSCGNIFSEDIKTIITGKQFTCFGETISKCIQCDFSNICGGCKADILSGETEYCIV